MRIQYDRIRIPGDTLHARPREEGRQGFVGQFPFITPTLTGAWNVVLT